MPWHFLTESLNSWAYNKKTEHWNYLQHQGWRERSKKAKILVWMEKSETGLKAHTGNVSSTALSTEIASLPAQTSRKSPFMIWTLASQTSLILRWLGFFLKKKDSLRNQQITQEPVTHVRECRCTNFSVFFPFFTFRRDNVATINRKDSIFTSRFWKSSSC